MKHGVYRRVIVVVPVHVSSDGRADNLGWQLIIDLLLLATRRYPLIPYHSLYSYNTQFL